MCDCIPGAEVVSLYPKEAYPYMPSYLTKYVPESRPANICYETDLLETCDEMQYFNKEACMCFSKIQCKMMCPMDNKMDPIKGCGCITV